jgi:hypothetical protein
MPQNYPQLSNLFPFNTGLNNLNDLKTGDRLSQFNLSNKRANDFNLDAATNDYSAFLIDSQSFYKTNRFFCVVFPPSNIKPLTDYYKQDKFGFRFTCEAVSLPTQTLETFDYRLNMLPNVKMPYMLNYGDNITLTFRMSKDFLERKFFLTWQENVFTFDGDTPGVRYMEEYSFNSSIILSQIDTANNKIYNTEFTQIYPTSVSGIEYSWMPGDEYVKQTVSFAFTRMFSEGTKSSPMNLKNTFPGI